MEDDQGERPAPQLILNKPELPPTASFRDSNLISALNSNTRQDHGNNPSTSIDFESGSRVVRDAEALTIIEKLEVGPYDHKAPEDDSKFNNVEPHSQIRLRRVLDPHFIVNCLRYLANELFRMKMCQNFFTVGIISRPHSYTLWHGLRRTDKGMICRSTRVG